MNTETTVTGDEKIISQLHRIKSNARNILDVILILVIAFYASYYHSADERMERGQESLSKQHDAYFINACALGRLQAANGVDGRDNVNYCEDKTAEEIVYINQDILNSLSRD